MSARDAQIIDQKQTDELRREHDRKMHNLRSDFRRDEEAVQDNGEAAVVHIKKATDERVDAARTASEKEIKTTSDNLNKNYSDMRRRATNQISSLDQKVEEAQDRSEQNITTAENREHKAIRDSQTQLNDFLSKQKEYRSQQLNSQSGELQSEKLKANLMLAKQKRESNQELNEVQKKSHDQQMDAKEIGQSNLKDTRDGAQRRLEELRQDSASHYAREEHQDTRELKELKTKAKDAAQDIQRESAREQAKLRLETKDDQQSTRDQAIRNNEKQLKATSQEAQRIEMTGKQDITSRQEKFARLLNKQEKDNSDTLKNTELEMTRQELKADEEHKTHLQENAEKAQLGLRSQDKNFKRTFDANQKVYKESLSNQKETYLKEQFKQSTRFDTAISDDATRAKDPFYSVKTFDAKMSERPGGFYIHAKVPPYDRKTVEVRIEKDRISLTAKRSYENEIKDGDSKAQTSTYQTYRQDFELPTTVDPDKAVTKIEEDGTINVFAPKKGNEHKRLSQA